MPADIRPARVSDIDALVSIENSVFGSDRISRRSFRRHVCNPSAGLLVANGNDVILGYALILFRARSRVARLYSLAVNPAHEKAGVGQRLLSAAEEASFSRGCPILRLEVREDNPRAIGLYQRAGYRRIGRREAYYEDGAAALRFQKDLSRNQ